MASTDGISLSTGGGAMGVLLGTPLETATAILPADSMTVEGDIRYNT